MTLEKNCQRRYFNPLPPHGGRPAAASYLPPHEGISIHSLRMEGDRYAVCGNVAAANFNPLPPHGGRLSPDVLYPETLGFQSTPSAWRETCRHRSLHRNQSHFNPLPPHGGRLRHLFSLVLAFEHFNPLPPHGGRRRRGM